MKRKAEDELRPQSAKRSPSASLAMNVSSSKSSVSNSLTSVQETQGEAGRGRVDIGKAIPGPVHRESTAEAKPLRRRTAATKEISPPPLRRKVEPECEACNVENQSTEADRYALASLSSAASSKLKIAYPNGALRITRTPGRRKTKNCVNLEDVIHKQHLVSACVFSFFISETEFFEHLPLSQSSDSVPVSAPHISSSSIRLTSTW
jgi:tyrosyl-DNA phosphodiesterase-1